MLTFRKSLCGVTLLALVNLAGCGSDAPPPDPTPGETKVVYTCENGTGFAATFRIGTESVLLEIDGQSQELAQVPSPAGVAYSDGVITFRFQGLTAYTEGRPGGDFTGCVGTNT